MKRIAFYGGSFDPVHSGHTTIAAKLIDIFGLDQFVFIPAFHAPHKPGRKPTSAFHRYAMLCLATRGEDKLKVSKMELDLPDKPYTVETLERLKLELLDDKVFFVMGADSWQDIRTWREWEKVLSMSDHIVVTRPGFEIDFSHVTAEIRDRIVDLRNKDFETAKVEINSVIAGVDHRIYITDAVEMDISATDIRKAIRNGTTGWQGYMPDDVAKYIEKYQIYK